MSADYEPYPFRSTEPTEAELNHEFLRELRRIGYGNVDDYNTDLDALLEEHTEDEALAIMWCGVRKLPDKP